MSRARFLALSLFAFLIIAVLVPLAPVGAHTPVPTSVAVASFTGNLVEFRQDLGHIAGNEWAVAYWDPDASRVTIQFSQNDGSTWGPKILVNETFSELPLAIEVDGATTGTAYVAVQYGGSTDRVHVYQCTTFAGECTKELDQSDVSMAGNVLDIEVETTGPADVVVVAWVTSSATPCGGGIQCVSVMASETSGGTWKGPNTPTTSGTYDPATRPRLAIESINDYWVIFQEASGSTDPSYIWHTENDIDGTWSLAETSDATTSAPHYSDMGLADGGAFQAWITAESFGLNYQNASMAADKQIMKSSGQVRHAAFGVLSESVMMAVAQAEHGGNDVVNLTHTHDRGRTWENQTLYTGSGTSSLGETSIDIADDGSVLVLITELGLDQIRVALFNAGAAAGGCEGSACGDGDLFEADPVEVETDWLGQNVFVRTRFQATPTTLISGVIRFSPDWTIRNSLVTCGGPQEVVLQPAQALSITQSGLPTFACQNSNSGIWKAYFAPLTLGASPHDTPCLSAQVDPPCFMVQDPGGKNLLHYEVISGNQMLFVTDADRFVLLNGLQGTIKAQGTLPGLFWDGAIDQTTASAWLVGDFGTRAYSSSGVGRVNDINAPGTQVEAYDDRVYIGTQTGLKKYSISGGSLVLNGTNNGFTFGRDFTDGMDITKDGQYLLIWDGPTWSLVNATNIGQTLTGGTMSFNINSGTLDVANNFVYLVGEDKSYVRINVQGFTTAFGQDGDTAQDPNPIPTPDPDGDAGDGSDFGAPQNPAVNGTATEDVPAGASGVVGTNDEFFGVSLLGFELGAGLGAGMGAFFLAILLVVAMAGTVFAATQSQGLAIGGGVMGFLMSVAFGLVPVWVPIFIVAVVMVVFVLRRGLQS